jgi:tetratricopeptide (TPR) repeat protein
MELMDGATLKEILRSNGTGGPRVLDIGIQIVDALEAAHGKGIIHRDVKPANIFVTARGQAKLLDFGLAKQAPRRSEPGDSEATTLTHEEELTRHGAAVGTVTYMSPEQARGETLDQRTDLFSFGVVAYEMATGLPPFRGTTPAAVTDAIPHQASTPPSQLNPSLLPDLDAVILRALEKDREVRYQTAADLKADLKRLKRDRDSGNAELSRGPGESVVSQQSGPARARSGRPAVAGAILLGLLVAGGLAWVRWSGRSRPAEVPTLKVVLLNHVAVGPFENRIGEAGLDSLGKTIAERIEQGLGEISSLEVVALPAADAVVTGSYEQRGGSLLLWAQISAPSDKRLLATAGPFSGTAAKPDELIELLAQAVMGRAASYADPVLAPYAHVIHLPNYGAYKEGMRGAESFLRADYRTAIPYLEHAGELDPSFIWALHAAGWAHFLLGEYGEAEAVARRLAVARESLTPYEQADLEALEAGLRGDLAGLYRGQRRKMELVPVAFRLYYLAAAAFRLNRPRETIRLLEAADPGEPGLRDMTYYWEFLTGARHCLGDHDRELEDAKRGRRQLPDRLGTLFAEARALAALGRVDEVPALLREGAALPPDPEWTPGRAMETVADELRSHGHEAASGAALHQAEDWYLGRSPLDAGSEGNRYGLARVRYATGRWDDALSLFENLHRGHPDHVDYLGYLGLIAARQGRREDAQRIAAQLHDLDRPYLFGRQTLWCARILAVLGDSAALGRLRDSLSEGQGFGLWLHVDVDFESLHDKPAFRELLEPKG